MDSERLVSVCVCVFVCVCDESILHIISAILEAAMAELKTEATVVAYIRITGNQRPWYRLRFSIRKAPVSPN